MSDHVKRAQEFLQTQAKAISRSADFVDESFVEALTLITKATKARNKLVFMGVGKSHYVAMKLAASFMSTGVTAIFVHPGEAFHGDLGSIREDDVVLLFSKSGRTAEILGILPFFKDRNPCIAITGDVNSPLAQHSEVVLNASIEKEACPINMLPTASTTVALALGDALVSCFAEEQGFSKQVFAGYHPGGSIGKRLNQNVADVYHSKEKCAWGNENTPLTEVAKAIGDYPLGVFNILDAEGKLLGIITDGDIRRAWAEKIEIDSPATTIMMKKPITLKKDILIDNAIATLEQKGRKVNCAPVVDENNLFLGLVHIHDLI
ncbi:KpsF/GutQ family sugar-phosphate isomerase [bacterium]|nr:KpsF/GutQ family sugar-phosphate isomerase [bacterium]